MDYIERMAKEWTARANDLAQWVMTHMVNRTDVWCRYVKRQEDERSTVFTVPFTEQRGKVFLDLDSLRKHFRTRQPGGQISLHSSSGDLTSRWLAIDIDLHDADDKWTVSREGNLAAARGWCQVLTQKGLDPLLMDSNGMGGIHILVVFAEPMSSGSAHEFVRKLTADFEQRGLPRKPEVFPGKPKWDHFGPALRLPGRHHSRPHYTRVWNDEPFAESPWLDGHDAIDRILATRPATEAVLRNLGMERRKRTICLDFDGVIHSYRSGWCGATVIPDPPIHGSREAISTLRTQYRVVVLSSRCHTEEGRKAVRDWLQEHRIEVDEVCEHKPPAHIYVDDRAIRFQGEWDNLLDQVREFRK